MLAHRHTFKLVAHLLPMGALFIICDIQYVSSRDLKYSLFQQLWAQWEGSAKGLWFPSLRCLLVNDVMAKSLQWTVAGSFHHLTRVQNYWGNVKVSKSLSLLILPEAAKIISKVADGEINECSMQQTVWSETIISNNVRRHITSKAELYLPLIKMGKRQLQIFFLSYI